MFAVRRQVFSVRFLSCENGIAKKMANHCVVSHVIDVAPRITAQVNYVSGAEAKLGNQLTPTEVKDQPSVRWLADYNYLYTLCMTDPDAPSRMEPKFREWHHWLVGNIPGGDIGKGDVLSAFIGAAPPKGSGLHRYVFLVYRQNSKVKFQEKRLPNNSGVGRAGFSIRGFAAKYKLGQPIAGNFFLAQWDDYVPILQKQLGA